MIRYPIRGINIVHRAAIELLIVFRLDHGSQEAMVRIDRFIFELMIQ